MPALDCLSARMKAEGGVVITVDHDCKADAASAYLARHGYTWPNYHDPGNLSDRAFHDSAIPLTVLIDRQGKLSARAAGADSSTLRDAIASMAPRSATPSPPAK
jgi:hypothetical protein